MQLSYHKTVLSHRYIPKTSVLRVGNEKPVIICVYKLMKLSYIFVTFNPVVEGGSVCQSKVAKEILAFVCVWSNICSRRISIDCRSDVCSFHCFYFNFSADRVKFFYIHSGKVGRFGATCLKNTPLLVFSYKIP